MKNKMLLSFEKSNKEIVKAYQNILQSINKAHLKLG